MQIKNVGGIPSLSHRNLTLQAGCSPKASVSSLEKVPSVILGCDLIAEAHRDSETRTVPAAIGCPIQPCASRSLFVPLANRENRYHEHHLPHTVPGIKQPPKGRGRQHWDFQCSRHRKSKSHAHSKHLLSNTVQAGDTRLAPVPLWTAASISHQNHLSRN